MCFAIHPSLQNIKTAYGYAVFPTIGKAGFVVGGSYGVGQVYCGGKVTGKSSVIEGSIGFQAGGKAFSEIIFFKVNIIPGTKIARLSIAFNVRTSQDFIFRSSSEHSFLC